MQLLIKHLLIIMLYIIPIKVYGYSPTILEINYQDLDTKLSAEQAEALNEIAKKLKSDPNQNILIEACAYQDYTLPQRLRITALKRAMKIRKALYIKGIEVDRIAINVLDLEHNKDNKIKIYQVKK